MSAAWCLSLSSAGCAPVSPRDSRDNTERWSRGCKLIGRLTNLFKDGKPVVRSNFVFDMRALGKHPGEFKDEKLTASAPDGVGSGLVLVPAGADVALDLRFEAVSEGVLVTGSAVAPLAGECARCLDPLTTSIEVSFQDLYRYLPDPGEDKDDGEERFLNGDLLD